MIPVVEILRRETDKSYGTLGIISVNKKIFGCTLEPGDEENKSFLSSIPTGQYTCVRVNSNKYGETFEVSGVTDRTNILFHPGNFIQDTAGCVCVGDKFGKLLGDRALKNSGKTFREFMRKMDHVDEFHLTIIEHY